MTAGTFAKATPDPDNVLGRWRCIEWTYTGSASYNTGGDAPPNLGIRTIRGAIILGCNSVAYIPIWNPTTGKIQLIEMGTAVSGPFQEAASAANVSAVVVTLLFISNDD